MDKDYVIHGCNGILLSHKKEWNDAICDTMQGPRVYHTKWHKSEREIPKDITYMYFPGGTTGKEPACQFRIHKRCGFDPWVRKTPWRRKWQPTPVFFPGESPWTEEPGGLQSMGLQRVGHNWSDLACLTYMWNLKYDTSELIHGTETDAQTKKTECCCQGVGHWERGGLGV